MKKSKYVRLTKSELNHGRELLMEYMTEHPVVRNADDARHISHEAHHWAPLLTLTHRPMFATIAVIVILALGGGTAFAAENALPGSPLYPVKVHINEQVRAAVAVGASADANWDARRAERRLEEAEALAAEGRLNADLSARLSERFETHSDRIQDRIEKMEDRGEGEKAAWLKHRFEASVEAHNAILTVLENSSTSTKNELREDLKPLIKDLRADIKAELKKVLKATSTVSVDGGVSATSSGSATSSVNAEARAKLVAEHAMRQSKHQLKITEELITRVEAKFGAEAVATAKEKLQLGTAYFVQGETAFNNSNFVEATEEFKLAWRNAQEARALLEIRAHVKLLPAVRVNLFEEDEVKVQQEQEDEDTDDADENATTTSENDEDENEDNRSVSTTVNAEAQTDTNIDVRIVPPLHSNAQLKGEVKLNVRGEL